MPVRSSLDVQMPESAHMFVPGYVPNIPHRQGQSYPQRASLPGKGVPFLIIISSTGHISAIEKSLHASAMSVSALVLLDLSHTHD
jgi:hypothetical protein